MLSLTCSWDEGLKQKIHRWALGKRTCVCGERTVSEPLFSAKFYGAPTPKPKAKK